jgi:hypothetical protein
MTFVFIKTPCPICGSMDTRTEHKKIKIGKYYNEVYAKFCNGITGKDKSGRTYHCNQLRYGTIKPIIPKRTA